MLKLGRPLGPNPYGEGEEKETWHAKVAITTQLDSYFAKFDAHPLTLNPLYLDSRAVKVGGGTGRPATRGGGALEHDGGDGGRGDKEVVLRVEEVVKVVDRFWSGGRSSCGGCWRCCGKRANLVRSP